MKKYIRSLKKVALNSLSHENKDLPSIVFSCLRKAKKVYCHSVARKMRLCISTKMFL